MEIFTELNSFVMQGKHRLGPPSDVIVTVSDADQTAIDALGLGTRDNIYSVKIDSYRRACVFRKWHGPHALSYSVRDDTTIAVVMTDVPSLVSVVE
jgi:hypothetical protein